MTDLVTEDIEMPPWANKLIDMFAEKFQDNMVDLLHKSLLPHIEQILEGTVTKIFDKKTEMNDRIITQEAIMEHVRDELADTNERLAKLECRFVLAL